MVDKIIAVTSPNYYHANQPSLMLYDVSEDDTKLIIEVMMESDIELSLHLGYTNESEREWLINTARLCDRVIINMEDHDLIKGYILNHTHVSYYNSNNDLKSLNINELLDPVEYILRFINEQQRRENEKSIV